MLEISKQQENFDKVINHFNGLDILVNNAGRSQRAPWELVELSVDRELFELDVFSVINLCRIAVKYFDKINKRGHLAVTSSGAGIVGVPFSPSYCGAKHALHVSHSDQLFRNFFTNSINFRDISPLSKLKKPSMLQFFVQGRLQLIFFKNALHQLLERNLVNQLKQQTSE